MDLGFIQDVLCGKKGLLKANRVFNVKKVPPFQELTVAVLYEKADDEVLHYLPDWKQTSLRKKPEKLYVWTILLTLRPRLCQGLVEYAKLQRDVKR